MSVLRLWWLPLICISTVVCKTSEPITIDGLDGWGIEATARHTNSGAQILVYQVVLFDRETHVLIQGRSGVGIRRGAACLYAWGPHVTPATGACRRVC